MSEFDKELEQLLKPLMEQKASALELARWKKKLRPGMRVGLLPAAARGWFPWAGSVAAALLIGFFVGRVSLKSESSLIAENDPIATIEYISVKSE